MAKRKQRAARIASVALLSSTVFANPPPARDKAPPQVIVNRPNPAYDEKPVDAGTPDEVKPVLVNEAPMRPPPTVNRMPVPRPESAPDAGVKKLKK